MNKRLLTLGIIVVLAGLAGAGVFALRQSNSSSSSPRDVNTVNYDGPTEEEAKAGDEQKAKEETDEAKDYSSVDDNVNFQLSDASQYGDTFEVRAFVVNVYEEGTCVATFTKAGQSSVATTSQAFKDATTTQCGANDTPISKFPVKGEWNLTVTFTSSTGKVGKVSQKVSIK